MSDAPLLEVESIVKVYRSPGVFGRKNARPALAGVSFAVEQGRSFGIVGESGSGKSTLARIALALDEPDSGSVRLEGRSLFDLPRRELRGLRAHMQMVFQDPYGSLDPRQRVETIVAEPLAALGGAWRMERRVRVRAALEAVGLDPADALKHPHEFSGGQRQRIAIARALITRPKLVVADEPVSALDVSVQAQVLNLMSDLEREAGVTFLLISHDLAVVSHLCASTAVLYQGRIVEMGATEALFARPAHPYTRELVEATPRLEGRAFQERSRHREDPRSGDAAIQGRTLRPLTSGLLRFARNDRSVSLDAPEGCPYAARCEFVRERCLMEAPSLEQSAERAVACHYPLD
jgi:peptide/nickel transport system ATP-binding protein